MKISVYAEARMEIPLTAAGIAVLKKIAEHHYDATCRMAGFPDGFISHWERISASWEIVPSDNPVITATWRELDLCLKILEMSMQAVQGKEALLAMRMRWLFSKTLSQVSKLLEQWKADIEVQVEDA